MKDDFSYAGAVTLQKSHRIIEGLSAMNDNGQIRFGGDFEMLSEDASLVLPQRMVVMIVKAGLADGDDLWICGELFQVSDSVGGYGFRIVGMNSDGSIKIFELLSELNGFLVFIRVGSYGEPAGDTCGDASSDDRIDVTSQIIKGQMTVCVEQLHIT